MKITKRGIIKSDGTEIVGPKYDNISYIENTGEFIVTNGKLVGIINNKGKTKIDLDYEEINVLDEDLGLYIVKQNNKYGVVNDTGKIIIYIENDDIGIDTSAFKDSNIKNPYLLFENCIVVKKDDKWGAYNKNGKLILPIEYDGIGCVVGTSSTKTAGNVVTIDDYEGIVIQKDKYYGIINSTGTLLIPCALDTIYSITSSGDTTYRIEGVQNGSPYSYDLEEYFDAINVKKVNRKIGDKKEINENTSSNTQDEEEFTNVDSSNTSEEVEEDTDVEETEEE